MKNIYCISIYGKYRKLMAIEYGNKNEKIFKEESPEILKIIDLIINIEEYQGKYG